jgi:tRNA uridine 5-carbamoylmethylation protein Kti12
MTQKLIIVIGAYGSGKSEYASNLAYENRNKKEVVLADLDVVNPYFRSREMREKFSKIGIDVIAPDGAFSHADVPMISPRIMGAIQNYDKTVILDVGGDPAGCRTLARFEENIKIRGYEMHFVINTKRPFMRNPDEIQRMKNMLESASGLQITELISNTNLMDETTDDIVADGIRIVEEVAQKNQLVFETYLVLEKHNEKISDNLLGKQKKILQHFFNKPWEMPVFVGI